MENIAERLGIAEDDSEGIHRNARQVATCLIVLHLRGSITSKHGIALLPPDVKEMISEQFEKRHLYRAKKELTLRLACEALDLIDSLDGAADIWKRRAEDAGWKRERADNRIDTPTQEHSSGGEDKGEVADAPNLEGRIEQLVRGLVRDEQSMGSLLRLLRLIDGADDDEKAYVTNSAIEYTYSAFLNTIEKATDSSEPPVQPQGSN